LTHFHDGARIAGAAPPAEGAAEVAAVDGDGHRKG
jgi:hypothetical protein